jgi:hypothetical protein
MNRTSALEKRIAVALSSNITAANLASLIAETETAVAAADEVPRRSARRLSTRRLALTRRHWWQVREEGRAIRE